MMPFSSTALASWARCRSRAIAISSRGIRQSLDELKILDRVASHLGCVFFTFHGRFLPVKLGFLQESQMTQSRLAGKLSLIGRRLTCFLLPISLHLGVDLHQLRVLLRLLRLCHLLRELLPLRRIRIGKEWIG